MKAAVYLRVSQKRDQNEANQEPDCARLCAARGWEPVWYRERESGVKERPQWRAVVEAARRGQVGAVVVWALDRVGRTRVQVAHDLAELGRFRVAIASVQDSWLDQPPGPLRDLLVQIMGWVAEGERVRMIERTRAGIARARAAGVKWGRKRREISGPAVVRARVLRAQGKSWADCAAVLVREALAAPGLTAAPLRRACIACESPPANDGGKAA